MTVSVRYMKYSFELIVYIIEMYMKYSFELIVYIIEIYY